MTLARRDRTSPHLAMVAGEASGDLLAGLLIDALRSRWPGVSLAGIGGPHMTRRGFDAWWPSERLAVRGYVEVLRHYRAITRIRARLCERLLETPPSAFIGIDAPDFNLGLAASLKAAGIPAIQFVCPSVWAWRAGRLATIRRSVDHVLCLFPFEPALLHDHGIGATYVGHPLASVIPAEPDRAAARRQIGLDANTPVVALLPGSRASEIDYLAARFLQAAARMARERPALRFVLPAVPAVRARVDAAVRASGLRSDTVTVLDGQSHAALAACDVTLIASGTATLEAALFKRPMVIAYNMNWLSWQIMRRKQLQPWVGLPNILCREFVVPEFLQERASPDALARATLDWLDHPDRCRQLVRRFTTLHDELRRDTARLATDAIEKILAR